MLIILVFIEQNCIFNLLDPTGFTYDMLYFPKIHMENPCLIWYAVTQKVSACLIWHRVDTALGHPG